MKKRAVLLVDPQVERSMDTAYALNLWERFAVDRSGSAEDAIERMRYRFYEALVVSADLGAQQVRELIGQARAIMPKIKILAVVERREDPSPRGASIVLVRDCAFPGLLYHLRRQLIALTSRKKALAPA